MPDTEQVLASRPDAPWLPAGGRAEVVLAAGGAAPTPTCVVRLLATCGGQVLTVPRPDGGGRDLPTRRVGDEGVEACLRTLLVGVLGAPWSAELLGYVRNVVDAPDVDYPWPVPHAHFAVWRCDLPAGVEVAGEWLDRERAGQELADRHWWPLAAHVLA